MKCFSKSEMFINIFRNKYQTFLIFYKLSGKKNDKSEKIKRSRIYRRIKWVLCNNVGVKV